MSAPVPGQAPVVPGQAPAVPGQAPVVPGQAPVVPGQAPIVPGQAPAPPAQVPVEPTAPAASKPTPAPAPEPALKPKKVKTSLVMVPHPTFKTARNLYATDYMQQHPTTTRDEFKKIWDAIDPNVLKEYEAKSVAAKGGS